jgi:hypothetical protein
MESGLFGFGGRQQGMAWGYSFFLVRRQPSGTVIVMTARPGEGKIAMIPDH